MRGWSWWRNILGALALSSGCTSPLPLEGRGCPCAPGYECCANICVRPGATSCGAALTNDGGVADSGDAADATTGVSDGASRQDAPPPLPDGPPPDVALPADAPVDQPVPVVADAAVDPPPVVPDAALPPDAPLVPSGWRPISNVEAPSARMGHTAIWTGTQMVVWGGGERLYIGQRTGGRYDPATDSWRPTSLIGAPSTRTNHAAVWIERTGEMMIWGGVDNGMDTGGLYDPMADSWRSIATAGSPQGRTAPVMVSTPYGVIVWCGGFTSAIGDGFIYDPVTDKWWPMSAVDAPGCGAHRGAWTGRHFVVWGAWPGSDIAVGGIYDPATDRWTRITTAGAPPARTNHVLVAAGDRMVVWAGSSEEPGATPRPLRSGGRFSISENRWYAMSETTLLPPLLNSPAVWAHGGRLGSRAGLMMWGGTATSGVTYLRVGEGALYEPDTDRWSALPSAGAPAPRTYHTLIWTGQELLVWGGQGTTAPLGNGARYTP